MRRRPNVSIQVTGGTYPGYPERRQRLYTAAPWGECWPRNLPFPESNRGLMIDAQAAVDGSLSNFSVGGNNHYPTVATCLMEKLQGASVGPSDRGEANPIRVSFGFYEIRR